MIRSYLRIALLASASGVLALAQSGGEIRFCLRGDPKTFDPLQVEDDNAETIRYITGGVLLRVNRQTRELIPELAESWKVDRKGRRITFHLRHGLSFSDGTPFSAEDVAYTFRLMDPEMHSATAESFRSDNLPSKITVSGVDTVSLTFHAPVANLERLFDRVVILSRNSSRMPPAVLGPFYVADYKPGVEVLLARNPHYWKVDTAGRPLPYLDRIRLQIQPNYDMELGRFRHGEVDLINSLDPQSFDQLARQAPGSVSDAGASLESEVIWFNQVPSAPLPDYKRAWFASQDFRHAISDIIHREELCKQVYNGHAQPAMGLVPPGNLASAQRHLEHDGFVRVGGTLYDRDGHVVEFSLAINAGDTASERMAAMIQHDLLAIGVKLNVVAVDLPALMESLSRSFPYEACLRGIRPPVLQSNAGRKTSASPSESEIIPLLNKHSLMAFSPQLRNLAPASLEPQAYWNIDRIEKSTLVAESH